MELLIGTKNEVVVNTIEQRSRSSSAMCATRQWGIS